MDMDTEQKTAAIIGGGPAGLMAAEVLSGYGVLVTVYDAMPSMGRKFLMAGKSGLNLTKAEPFEKLISYYDNRVPLRTPLKRFGSNAVRDWAERLGQELFVGSTGQVFPVVMKASPLLRAWLTRLSAQNVSFKTRHKWTGWEADALIFDTPEGQMSAKADVTVLALGGASWPRLGSDGGWTEILAGLGAEIADFKPSNCGFDVGWSEYMQTKFAGVPVKNIRLTVGEAQSRGDFVLTEKGIEGGAVYKISAALREHDGPLTLDLMPDMTVKKIATRLAKPRGKKSLTEHWRKSIHLTGVKAALLREFASEHLNNIEATAKAIKALPMPVEGPRPIVEAISTAGGLSFGAMDFDLMLNEKAGVFCAGEMLDWDAPTGGYLLTACFATGRAAGQAAARYIDAVPENIEPETDDETPIEEHDWRALIKENEDLEE